MDGQGPLTNGNGSNNKLHIKGAAAIKPTETVVEAIAGKKKSKFWVYAVEPIVPAEAYAPPPPASDYEMSDSAGPSTVDEHQDDVMVDVERESSTEYGTSGDSYKKSIEGSLSPDTSMDES